VELKKNLTLIRPISHNPHKSKYPNIIELLGQKVSVPSSVQDPDPYVFGPSGSASFHQPAKNEEKSRFLLFCDFFMTFYL
jgi:hypothetical protein